MASYDFLVYSVRGSISPPTAALAGMESYIAGGGDLLITGITSSFDMPDRRAAELIRAIGPEFGFSASVTQHTVTTLDNFITNGPFGDVRGQMTPAVDFRTQLFANTGLGTIPILRSTSGQPDKAIFTDLPGVGGSVGAWQGANSNPLDPAQPNFYDGGLYQSVFLNWVAGGTTTQTEVTPVTHSTAGRLEASRVSLDLYIGDPNQGGALLASAGPFGVTGTADVVASLDSTGNGTLAVVRSDLVIADATNQLVDLGPLGSMLLDFSNVHVYLANQPADVTANAYNLQESPYFVAGLLSGSLRAHSPVGAVGSLVTFPVQYELNSNYLGGPGEFIGSQFDGTFDLGPGLFSSGGELNLAIDRASLPAFDVSGLGQVYFGFRGDFHFAAAPEPSTLGLAVGGGIALLATGWRMARGRCRDSVVSYGSATR